MLKTEKTQHVAKAWKRKEKRRKGEKRGSMEMNLLLTACWYRGWPLRGLCPLSKSSESRAGLRAASRLAGIGLLEISVG